MIPQGKPPLIVTMLAMTRERRRKRKNGDSVVTEVPDCQEEKDTDKEEEYVRLLNGIQMDVKRLWEGLLFCHVVSNSANTISVKPKLIL